jgi:ribose transport system permease protein
MGLVVLCGYFAMTQTGFIAPTNLLTVALQISVVAIIAIAETFVIVAGGIDLSVGSVVAFSGVVAAVLMKSDHFHASPAVASLAGIGVGAACGLANGLIITRMGLPPFIATLGMMGICRGLALSLTDGQAVSGLSESFGQLGNGRLAGILPIPVVMLILVAILAHILLRTTCFGRYTYALGSNAEAARLSGVNVKAYSTAIFTLCGALTGLAGIILAARLNIGQPTAGQGYELDAIAAAVIGGASLMGGRGTIGGTLIGAFIMAVLHNGCDLKNVGVYWQQIIIGAIIVVAVFGDTLRQRRRGGG